MQELVTTESIPKKSPTTLILCHHIHPAAVTIHTKYKCNKSSRVQWSYKASNSLHSSKPWGGGGERVLYLREALHIFSKTLSNLWQFPGTKTKGLYSPCHHCQFWHSKTEHPCTYQHDVSPSLLLSFEIV
jgi:hypothetical protein